MQLISFDIGIKNMAYCIFDISGPNISCTAWTVLNLVDAVAARPTATCCSSCTRKAKFRMGDSAFFCEAHTKRAERDQGYKRPSREWTLAHFKKKKVHELRSDCQMMMMTSTMGLDAAAATKEACLAQIQQWLARRVLSPVAVAKAVSASDADLIQVGRQLCTQLDAALGGHPPLNHVIIENQISPLAARMRTLQGMLTQYFILRHPDARIDYVSSSMKLKEFNATTTTGPVVADQTLAQKYKQHKTDGIAACASILEANPAMGFSQEYLTSHAKKDDLADCCLQALWFLKHVAKKINWSAEDLNIKCVDS